MLGVINSELDIINDIINKNTYGVKTYDAILMLIKYMYVNGERDKLNIKETIIQLLSQCDKDFSRTEWNEHISKAIDNTFNSVIKYNKELKINDIKKIQITKKEINTIDSIEDKKIRKIAFIILLYAKINNIVNNSNGWINQSYTNIFKESSVSGNRTEKLKMLHILYSNELISMNMKSSKTSIKINYIDLDENSEVAFYVTDFEYPIYQYLIYEGYNYKKCEVCGKYFKQTSNTKPKKYCNKCAKDIKNKQNKQYYKNLGKI